MIFHHRSNVNLCLTTLTENDVEFVNIHADEIMDGNEKITLGLIWTILHHFQLNKELSPVSELDPKGMWFYFAFKNFCLILNLPWRVKPVNSTTRWCFIGLGEEGDI